MTDAMTDADEREQTIEQQTGGFISLPNAQERAETAALAQRIFREAHAAWLADNTNRMAAGAEMMAATVDALLEVAAECERGRDTIATLRAQLASAEAERDALQRHYDAASGPDHNLLALLDLYEERRDDARAALATAREQLGAVREAARAVLEAFDGQHGVLEAYGDADRLTDKGKWSREIAREQQSMLRPLRAALTAPAKETSRDE